MRHIVIAAILWIGLFPVSVSGQESRFEKRFSHGKGLYSMERYSEAYVEFLKAGECAFQSDKATRERLAYYTALSAANAEAGAAEGLLKAYLAAYPTSSRIPEVHFALGNIYFAREDYVAAAAYYEATDPGGLSGENSDEYNFKIGYSCFRTERFDPAVQYMSRIEFKSDYYPHAQYVLGYSEYMKGNYRAAKRYFTVIADHPSYRSVLPFYVLQIEFKDGNYQYVRENGGEVLRMASGDRVAELNRIIAESWFHTGGWREAAEYLKRYEELGGAMEREELYMLGFSAYMMGDYGNAERYLSLVAGPDDKLSQNASYHLADCYLRTGRKQQAMQSFAIASTDGYDDFISEDALFNYGKLQYELGGGYFNEAVNVLNRYLDLYPNSSRVPQVKEYLAAAYYNSRNYDAAYQAIMQVSHPDNDLKAALQKITYFRALEYFNVGDYRSADLLLEQSLANRFNAKYTALAGLWQGEIRYRQGDMKSAAERYEMYVRLSPRREPENLAARYNLGYSYFNMKDWERAKKWFDDFLLEYGKKDRYAADAYNRLGDIEYAGRSFWRAIEYYDKAAAIGTDERYYSALQRAMMLGMVQRPERKIESLLEIIRKNEGPYVADAMYELGRAYMGQQRYTEAAGILERFASSYPASLLYASALNELGLAYQNLNDNAKALVCYKKVMDRESNSEAARSAMAGIRTIYVESNEVDSYFAYAKSKGIETDLGEVQRDSIAFVAAQKVYLSGDRNRAGTALDNYIFSYPKGVFVGEALYFAGENSLAAGSKERAAGYYRRLADMSDNDFTQRGLGRLAALDIELKRYGEAAEAYLRLSKMAVSPAGRDDALAGYLTAVSAEGNDGKILAAADEVLSASSSEQVKIKALYAKATALRRGGRLPEALSLYADLGKDVSSVEGAESAYRLVEAAYSAGDFSRVEELVYDFADRNSPHSYWLGRSFLLLGDVYAGKGDKFQARATYQSIVDGYPNHTDGIVKEAKERIASL